MSIQYTYDWYKKNGKNMFDEIDKSSKVGQAIQRRKAGIARMISNISKAQNEEKQRILSYGICPNCYIYLPANGQCDCGYCKEVK